MRVQIIDLSENEISLLYNEQRKNDTHIVLFLVFIK